jgi:hypothetical protein
MCVALKQTKNGSCAEVGWLRLLFGVEAVEIAEELIESLRIGTVP